MKTKRLPPPQLQLYGPNDARNSIAAYDLGVLYDYQDGIDEAIPLRGRALKDEQTKGDGDKTTIYALENSGTVYASKMRYPEAEAILQRVARGYEKLSGADHDGMSRKKRNLAKTYARQDRLPEAVAMYVLQRVYRETLGPGQASTGEIRSLPSYKKI
ncbi:hypothetical protein PoHVEF18_002675 [Penicillium ochrochloron]